MLSYRDDEDASSLPLVAQPSSAGSLGPAALSEWIASNRSSLHSLAHRHGALLLRGFDFTQPRQFEDFSVAFTGGLRDYIGGSADRHRVEGMIYTASDYSPRAEIKQHNEGSYLPQMPRWILLFCQQAAAEGGCTPLSDSRAVLRALPDDIRTEFERRRVCYITNLHSGFGFGISWQRQFETEDRDEVERRLTADGYEFRWGEGDTLQISLICDAIRTHPVTGEQAWVAQITEWHSAGLPAERRRRVAALERRPKDARFGDGGDIPDDMVTTIDSITRSHRHLFDWRAGDVLVIDNFVAAHGRQPFRGERQVFATVA